MTSLIVKRLSLKATLPTRALEGSAGYDLSSAIDTVVPAYGKALCPTDLMIIVPPETYGRIAPRSGISWKHHLDIGCGVIDASYRGAVGVVLFNHSDTDFKVSVGDRIAQLILEKCVMDAQVKEVDEMDTNTERGTGGFGSTGVGAIVVAKAKDSNWITYNTSS